MSRTRGTPAALKRVTPASAPGLSRLHEDFDRELAVLRKRGAADKLREIYAASPQDIADAANAASDNDE
jgi:hypothetical protein